MTGIELELAWLQKHPTPSSRSFDFHWHGGPLACQAGQDILDDQPSHPYSHLSWKGGRLVWARSFAATSKGEQRRYTGYVVMASRQVLAFGDVVAALRGLPDVAAGPWVDGVSELAITGTAKPLPEVDRQRARRIARGVLFGGDHKLEDPLAAVVAPASSAILELVGQRLCAEQMSFRGPGQELLSSPLSEGHNNMAHYVGCLALGGGDPRNSRQLWAAAKDLAAFDTVSPAELFAELSALVRAWSEGARFLTFATTSLGIEALRMAEACAPAPLWYDGCDTESLWARILNYWGRGFFSGGHDIRMRLARLVALRALADHLLYLDDGSARPFEHMDIVTGQALLPNTQQEAMLAAVGELSQHLMAVPRPAHRSAVQ